jgi:tripartite-type tricarboxylate transporter receptor subunit TctC
MTRRVFSKSLLALSLGLTLVGSAVAQSYPSRPITMVVPWGAGGGTDATARIVAALMEKEMGQPVVWAIQPSLLRLLTATRSA